MKSMVIPILVTLIACIFFMVAAWVRFERIERELMEHKTDLYVLKLVQTELLDKHGLMLEVTRKDSHTKEPKIEIVHGDSDDDD